MLSQLLVSTTDAKQRHIFNGATIPYQIKTMKAAPHELQLHFVLWQLCYILGAHVALYVVVSFPKVQIA